MSTQVILTATKGPIQGQEFAFTGRVQSYLGRSHTCEICLSVEDYTASRRHCLLDVDPPFVTVQDLGSLNGTFVNGELIGRRDKRLEGAEETRIAPPCHPLEDGDELRLGDTVFHVQIVTNPLEAEFEEKAGSTCLMCI